MNTPNAPTTRARVTAAILVGLACGAFTYALHVRSPQLLGFDFNFHWRAARALVEGHNPYAVIQPTGAWPFSYIFFYPLPSAFIALPLAWLLPWVASAVAVGASSALLAFATTRDGYFRLPLFLSAQFMMAASAGAAPAILLTAVIAWPALQWLVVVKPNLGLAAFAAQPTWRAIVGTLALCAIGLALVPSWPIDWIRALFATPGGDVSIVLGHLSPVMVPGGVLILLALLRWRRPEARMLAVLALVPQTMTFHDVLPTMLVARTFRQSLTLALLSHGAFLLARNALTTETDMSAMFGRTAPLAVWLMYMPAVALVLARPNGGTVPDWAERLISRWPAWVRGSRA